MGIRVDPVWPPRHRNNHLMFSRENSTFRHHVTMGNLGVSVKTLKMFSRSFWWSQKTVFCVLWTWLCMAAISFNNYFNAKLTNVLQKPWFWYVPRFQWVLNVDVNSASENFKNHETSKHLSFEGRKNIHKIRFTVLCEN